jgi:hypothetical protein
MALEVHNGPFVSVPRMNGDATAVHSNVQHSLQADFIPRRTISALSTLVE